MAIKFRKRAIKFLEKATNEEVARIRERLFELLSAVEQQGVIPFTELEIKKMKGNWEGYYRLRLGKIRIIFTIDFNTSEIEVYAIGSRGDIYK